MNEAVSSIKGRGLTLKAMGLKSMENGYAFGNDIIKLAIYACLESSKPLTIDSEQLTCLEIAPAVRFP
jgi:hypothetical protein